MPILLQVLFDSAYQGYSSGSLDTDSWALRHFVQQVTRRPLIYVYVCLCSFICMCIHVHVHTFCVYMCIYMKGYICICMQRSHADALLTFCSQGFEMIITQSFAKNMGM